MSRVNERRSYESPARRAQAERTRSAVLDAARRAFAKHGYAATTIASVASTAGVSVETIYKSFGGKPGLVRALYRRALEGRGPMPAEGRSDAMSASAADGHAIVKGWGRLLAEVTPLVSPILLVMRDAAAEDPQVAALLREHDAERLARMRKNARVLADRGFLRKGVTVELAAEIMWGYASAEIYDLFIVRRGWTPAQLGAFVADSIAAAVLRR